MHRSPALRPGHGRDISFADFPGRIRAGDEQAAAELVRRYEAGESQWNRSRRKGLGAARCQRERALIDAAGRRPLHRAVRSPPRLCTRRRPEARPTGVRESDLLPFWS